MSQTADTSLVAPLGAKFIARRDVKAVMDEPHVEYGGKKLHWQPIRSPFTMADFEAHLAGTRTFGHYMVSPEDNCKLFAIDIDLRENKPDKFQGSYYDEDSKMFLPCNPRLDWGQVDHPARNYLTRHLAVTASLIARTIYEDLGIEDVAIALSGNKGLHVYGFTGDVPATFAKEAAIGALTILEFTAEKGDVFYQHDSFPNLSFEVFPKQESMDGKDLGNLMALPLGVHRTTGKRKQFVTIVDDNIKVVDPHEALGGYKPWQ